MASTSDNSRGSDGDLYLKERDQEIFRLLDPEHDFHYLPSNWIHAFTGGDQLRLAKRLGRLVREDVLEQAQARLNRRPSA